MCKVLNRSSLTTDYKTLAQLKEWYPEGEWSSVNQGQILKAFVNDAIYNPTATLQLVPKASRRVYAKALFDNMMVKDPNFDWESFHNSYL